VTSLADLPRFNLPAGHTATSARGNSNGHVVITQASEMPRLGWLSRITAGGVLLASAGLLLLALAVAMGVVSWHAQFAFIFAIKHQRLAAALEALGLDCGAVVFSMLGIALARLGRRAIIERALVCICAAGSCAMNAAGSDLGSPRSVAAFIMPPLLFAITSDRLIAVIRRSALGRSDDDESQRSAWRVAGTAFLYALRFVLAPPSTARGARQAVLNATPLPELPTSAPAQLPAASPAALASTSHETRSRTSGRRQPGPTKAARLLALAAERHDLATVPQAEVSSIASGIAAEVDLHPGTARRVLLDHVRQLQAGGAE
jgi:hypothetical protein